MQNTDCSIAYEKYEKPTKYISHLWGTDQCYLSTFTTDLADKATYVYAKGSFENVMDAEKGDAFAVTVRLYKDIDCSNQKSLGETYSVFHDTLPKTCQVYIYIYIFLIIFIIFKFTNLKPYAF